MKELLIAVLFLCAFVACTSTSGAGEYRAAPYPGSDTYADTWVATDGAGRKLPGFQESGPAKQDRWVGIFYWTWHRPQAAGPNDNTKLIASAANGPVRWPENGAPHHWGEPELGYYLMTDPFVIRKHASMLADAGVDVILFDTTNPPFTWKDEYEALCREYTALRRQGNRTPAIAFIAPFGDPRPVTDQLWRELYQPGRWKDLWFTWDGKPLLLADKQFIKDPAMRAFFTFRRPMPDYWLGPSGADQWSWLEVYPQHVFTNAQGEAEQMSVGVAQNALPHTPGPAPMSHKAGAMGRSWHNGDRDLRARAVNLGLNFEEQWRRALEVNPKFIFVTGWNEWIAGRYAQWSKYTDADCYYPGGLFVDEYTQEYSRDCEPMRGGHGDNYYYQLVSWVRKFKGVREPPFAEGPSRIAIDGSFDDWQGVRPEFRDSIGDTFHRDHTGYGDQVYRNDTGRNDFVICKCAYDATNLYFYAQTLDRITPRTGTNWMLLFLDTDRNAATGWFGYDYIVNLEIPTDQETTLKAWRFGSWETLARIPYRVNGNGLELSIPRAVIGQSGPAPAFDFHWADNIQSLSDISEFGINGDSAPNRRWNYRYQVRGARQASGYAIGADLSFLKQAEERGTVFKDRDQAKPGLQIFKDHGYNWIRLRLFHTPSQLPNNLAYTLDLAKSAHQLAFKFLLDFHYSDTWADPGKQYLPRAWQGKTHTELVEAVFAYTRDTLISFREAGAMPDMVQVGNEISHGMLWPDGKLPGNWDNFADLVKGGIRGIEAARGQSTEPRIMIHIDKGGDRSATKYFFDKLNSYGITYDVIGQSYYPWWQGSLAELRENLAFMADAYRKDIMVVETAYNWRPAEYQNKPGPFPESPQGQKEFLEAVNEAVMATPQGRGKGVFWWEPAVTANRNSRGMCDNDGNALPVITLFDDRDGR